jgi:NADH:ubiquinone oxidoreductase subunit E/NAD-dependent dihydropyrimidine dehydrogenase PreA subunit
MANNGKTGATLVVGGGIGGIQAALDLAESGFRVYLLERSPSIGGIMAQLDKTFPTNDCSMCILAPKLVSVARHPNITVITDGDIEQLSGEAGDFVVTLRKEPRYVDEEKCTGCGLCMQNCPVRQVLYDEPQPDDLHIDPADVSRIDAILKDYRDKKGALMPVLQAINNAYNYFPKDLLKYMARELKIPLSLIYNVATFYKAFSLKKRGRYVIRVCQGTACHVRGAKRVLEEFERILGIESGSNTTDLLFTLETVNCVGACALAPVIMVGDEYFGHMTPGKVQKVLDNFYLEGKANVG